MARYTPPTSLTGTGQRPFSPWGDQPRVGENMFGVDVETAGTIATLKEWREDAAKYLVPAYTEIARKVVAKASPNVPVVTGTLKADLRAKASKTAANVRVGRTKIPYAAVAHWGWQTPSKKRPTWKKSKPGPQFIWLVGYPTGTQDDGPADWIEDILTKAVNKATANLSRKMKRDTGLGSGAHVVP